MTLLELLILFAVIFLLYRALGPLQRRLYEKFYRFFSRGKNWPRDNVVEGVFREEEKDPK